MVAPESKLESEAWTSPEIVTVLPCGTFVGSIVGSFVGNGVGDGCA
jgi:hypothetical protein